jgi:hypothetical protein
MLTVYGCFFITMFHLINASFLAVALMANTHFLKHFQVCCSCLKDNISVALEWAAGCEYPGESAPFIDG